MAGEGGAMSAKPKSELHLRVISAIVMALGAIGSAWWGGLVFVVVWGAIFALVFQEWLTITLKAANATGAWRVSGLLYSLLPLVLLIALRTSDSHGMAAVFFLFAVVWGADIGAYFAGRTLGGPKLAPRISPNKTWSGLVGGLLTATGAGLLLLHLMGYPLHVMHAVLAAVLALVSAAGDLFESHFKRRFGVKDSGHLIPGHGGFMDRLDGFIVAAILGALIGLVRGGWGSVGAGLLAGW